MNELLFLAQALLFILLGLGALRLGKEALFCWVCLQALLANLFVLKQISCFGCTITCSDAYAIGSLLALNLLQEYYGKKSGERASLIAFWAMLAVAVVSKLHLLFIPSLHDTTQAAFVTILGPAPRLLVASLLSFFLVQRLELWLFGLLKERWRAPLSLRSTATLLVSQLCDTVCFTYLGLYGSVASPADIIGVSYLVKCVMIFLSTPLMALSRRAQGREDAS